jgi:hypothetical protein
LCQTRGKSARLVGNTHFTGVGIKRQHPEFHLQVWWKLGEADIKTVTHNNLLLCPISTASSWDLGLGQKTARWYYHCASAHSIKEF